MTRLINADSLLGELRKSCKWHAENSRELSLLQRDINIVEEQPTVDAVPVRHAKWIWKGEDGDSRWMCSACLWKERVPTCNGVPNIWNYCPYCGARMDAERKEK